MNEVVGSLLNYLRENWPEVLWIIAAAGFASYLAGRRSRLRWQRREFLDRLNVTLTSIEDGILRIRTILEMDCDEIFLNDSAAKSAVEFAKRTTEADPILPIPKDDCWQYLNAVLNEVGERFAAGQIKRDLGLPVERGTYLLCLTCERAGPIRTHKIRAMLIRKSMLLQLPAEEPAYENPWHATRWDTLKKLSAEFGKHPHRFIEMEICMESSNELANRFESYLSGDEPSSSHSPKNGARRFPARSSSSSSLPNPSSAPIAWAVAWWSA